MFTRSLHFSFLPYLLYYIFLSNQRRIFGRINENKKKNTLYKRYKIISFVRFSKSVVGLSILSPASHHIGNTLKSTTIACHVKQNGS